MESKSKSIGSNAFLFLALVFLIFVSSTASLEAGLWGFIESITPDKRSATSGTEELVNDEMGSDSVVQYKPLPSGPEAITWKKIKDKREGWFQRSMSSRYKENGSHSEKWDSKAFKFINHFGTYLSKGFSDKKRKQLLALGKSTLDAGCDDPYITYLYGNILYNQKGAKQALPYVLKSYESLQKSSYSPLIKFYSTRRLRWIYSNLKKNSLARPLRKLELDYLAQAIADPWVADGGQRIYESEIKYLWENKKHRIEANRVYQQILKVKNADPWVLNLMKGRNHLSRSWKLRGSGMSDTVTEKGWVGFRKEMDGARDCLTRAYALHPEYPEPAAAMVTVRMATGGPVTIREWFNRSVEAQFDYLPAYENYTWSIRPRWGGSHDMMWDFAMECKETNRFDTNVPFKFMFIIYDISHEQNRWRAYYADPIVYAQIQDYFKKLLSHPHRKKHTAHNKSYQSVVAWAAGRLKEAKNIHDELGESFVPKVFSYLDVDENEFKRDLELLNGQYGEDVMAAKQLEQKGERNEAAKKYLVAYENNHDEKVKAYIFKQVLNLPFPHEKKYFKEAMDLCLSQGCREKVFVELKKYLANHRASDEYKELRKELSSTLGEANIKYIEILPQNFESALVFPVLYEDLKSIPRGKSKKDDMDFMLAELRLLFSLSHYAAVQESDHKKKYYKNLLSKRFKKLTMVGAAVDFINTHLSQGTLSATQKWHVSYEFYQNVTRRHDRNERKRKQIIKQLSAISKKSDLTIAIQKKDQYYGTPALLLQMASLCKKRGLESEALRLEDKALTWLNLWNNAMNNSVWVSWHAMATLTMVNDYEEYAVRYGYTNTQSKASNSGNYLAAHALLRLGRLKESVVMTIAGKASKKDGGRFFLPNGSYSGTKNLLKALLEDLLSHPDLTDDLGDQLQDAFPSIIGD